MNNMEMGEKIRFLREKHSLTLEQVGNAVGVGKSTVRKWETGMIANMRRDKIAALAKILQTTPAYLMGWNDDNTTLNAIELTTDETQLITDYRNFNNEGKEKVRTYVSDLKDNPKYKKSDQSEIVKKQA